MPFNPSECVIRAMNLFEMSSYVHVTNFLLDLLTLIHEYAEI